MVHVEFTIEPFIEGRMGAHVTDAIAAVEARGHRVEIGPFGSSCDVPDSDVGTVVGTLTDAALTSGASHVTVNVTADAPGNETSENGAAT
ncbi:MAG: thiamine-binding protein [Actinomycetota bacterium]